MIPTVVLAVCWAATIIVLLARDGRREADHAIERREWAAERCELNLRIQAPELAPVIAYADDDREPERTPYFHDEYAEIVANRENM